MREDEIKKIANEVVKILGRKGLTSLEPNINKPFKGVTMGSGGKIFQKPLVNKPSSMPSQKKEYSDAEADCQLDKNTCGPECQECNPLSYMSEEQFKGMGVDRIGLCNADEKTSSIAGMIDHTLLKANSTQEEIGKLCEDARKYCFASVCINPAYVTLASRLLRGSGVKVCTVIGFPLGSSTPTIKAIEARDAIANGADEIDMVLNIGALKSGNDRLVLDDIKAVRTATCGKILKVILETSYLSKEEKIRACILSKEANADFVKTSTGFGSGGATVEDIALMRATVGAEMGVKASGGIKDAGIAQAMIKAGATRLGTSASIAIISGGAAEKGQY